MIQNQKSDIRKKFLKLRKEKFDNIVSQQIIQNLADFLKNHNFKSIGLYHPINYEVDILKIIPFLSEEQILALPKIENKNINFYQWNKNNKELILNPKYNLLEPKNSPNQLITPKIILTPLAAFDKNLYRLGYGGGYYDRYFAHHNQSNIIKIGIAFDFQQHKENLPITDNDVALDHIITEKSILSH